MQSIITFLRPWEFSPTVLASCALPAAAYIRGLALTKRKHEATGFWRPLSFFVGLGLIYIALQTYFDFLSQHMFWVHRLQHLILHHVGPFLVVLAAPMDMMSRGVPIRFRERILHPLWHNRVVQGIYTFLQNPIIAPVLFVGLIYFWLSPAIHFTVMLNEDRYRLMNWSMVVDGILFWWLMLAPRTTNGHANISYMKRILILFIVMIGQVLLGAYIFMHKTMLYDVYGICGRAWEISPMTDQQIGGLITWIPPSMMCVIAVLVVLRRILHEEEEIVPASPALAGVTTPKAG
ncbi:MAG: cytochrome c oxidase assembly protein [Pseudomonadota bacterium]